MTFKEAVLHELKTADDLLLEDLSSRQMSP